MFLIIGANGQIGSELVKRLAADGQKVRALFRDPAKARVPGGVEVVNGDLADPASLEKAMQGVRAAFVLSANEAILDEKNAFAAAKRAGVAHVVLLSVAGAQKGSPVRLGDMHGQSEDALKASGVSWTILQPTMFASNALGHAGSVKAEGRVYGAMKEGRVPVIDPADIAATAAAILAKPAPWAGRSLYLTGPEALTQAQQAQAVARVAGKPVAYVDIPVDALVNAIAQSGAPRWLAEDFGKLHAWFATDAGATVSDAVREVTGRAPRSFDAWLADNAAAFRA